MFVHPEFLWFLPLLGVVALIHLINMFRHRRVDWAAMEFLLAGYRKSRVRILLRQLLLMLLRMTIIAAIVLMLAQPKIEGRLAELFGGKPTRHLVLLDDSFSMNDRNAVQGGTPLFEDALGVVRRLVDGAVKRRRGDRLTLIRLSRAASSGNESPELADLPLDDEGARIVADFLGTLRPSQSGAEPEEMIAAAVDWLRRSTGRFETAVYFVSDFRRRNWDGPSAISDGIAEIRRLGGTIRMIRIADGERPNLGIGDLRLVDGIHAADIDLLLDVDLVNHGLEDAENVHLALRIDGETQPGLTVPRIRVGERTVPPYRFPVRLAGSGQHRVEVQLPGDAIPDDNRRFLVVDVPSAVEVLLIAPEKRGTDAHSPAQYVRVALSPGGTKSGIRTRVEPASYLAAHPLDAFGAVFLLDVPTLEIPALKALEKYVDRGGGLAVFLGPESQIDFVRDALYKNGEGLFPGRPVAVTTLEPDFLTRTPDLVVAPHPMFRLFEGGGGPLLGNVRIERYVGVEPDSLSGKTIGTLRDGAPLIVEKEYGKGRTVSFLTSVDPVWNNWARGNPGFVVMMLELVARLAKHPEENREFLVGDPIPFELDPTVFGTDVRVVVPAPDEQGREKIVALRAAPAEDGRGQAAFPETTVSGFYEADLKDHVGNETKRFFAVNVDADEGDTRLADPGDVSNVLRPLGVSLESAAGFSASPDFAGERSLTDWMLYAVLMFLVAETFLAGRLLKG